MQFNQTELLRKRYWTKASINAILGEPDSTRKIWYGGGNTIEYLWDADQVMQAEKGKEFRAARSALFTRRTKRGAGKAVKDAAALAWVKRLGLPKEDLQACVEVYSRLKKFLEVP